MVLPLLTALYLCHILPLSALGYSVIPLRTKAAQQGWKQFQTRRATPAQLQRWFKNSTYSAYGVLCGQISNLMVLDFDDLISYEQFIIHFPHLAETYRVLSGNRGLPHLYFRVNFPVQSRSFPGGDLRGEGTYVVGAGSMIDGKTWVADNVSSPYELSEADYQAMLTYFYPPTAPRPTTLAQTFNDGVFDGIRYFQAHIDPLGGRNKALFQTACVLRDKGYSQSEAENLLTAIYVQTLAPSDHPPESATSRERAARCSIASAYRQSPRPNATPRPVAYVETNAEGELVSRLPNALREYLLTFGEGASVLRVWESLLLAGFAPGHEFTRREAYAQLAEGVGRPALDAALHFALDGEPLFPIKNRFCPTNEVRIKGGKSLESLEESLESALAGKRGAGENQNALSGVRPRVYVMPSIRELCQRLRLKTWKGDPLLATDLQTPGTYRGAMQRELVIRRKGNYDQKWNAARLNVTDRTIRRYNKAQHIQSTPRTKVQIVTTNNLKLVPVKGKGQFLETPDGKRYPPQQSIAHHLLTTKNHPHLCLKTYTTSLYAVADKAPDWNALGIPTEIYPTNAKPQSKPQPPTRAPRPTSPPAKPAPIPAKSNAPALPIAAPATSNPPPRQQPVSPPAPPVAYQAKTSDPHDPKFFRPLRDAAKEQVAQRLHSEVARLSICNARRLVYDFGVALVEQVWVEMRPNVANGKIYNPAGCLITRVEGKAAKTRTTINPAEFHGQAYPYRNWHPDKPKVDCQCQYCAKTMITETPFTFCSPECEKFAHQNYWVFSPEFGDWNYGIIEAPGAGWHLGTEKVVEWEDFPHLRVRICFNQTGQFEHEVIILPAVEPSMPPRSPMPPPPPKPRKYGPPICPATGEAVIIVYHSEVRRTTPEGSLQWFWRYQVLVRQSKHWYYLLIPKGEDIRNPQHFFEESFHTPTYGS